jgi:hypothetical protein
MDLVEFTRSFLGTYSPADVQTDAGGTFVLVVHNLGRDYPMAVVFADGPVGAPAAKIEHVDPMTAKVYCSFSNLAAIRVLA